MQHLPTGTRPALIPDARIGNVKATEIEPGYVIAHGIVVEKHVADGVAHFTVPDGHTVVSDADEHVTVLGRVSPLLLASLCAKLATGR